MGKNELNNILLYSTFLDYNLALIDINYKKNLKEYFNYNKIN